MQAATITIQVSPAVAELLRDAKREEGLGRWLDVAAALPLPLGEALYSGLLFSRAGGLQVRLTAPGKDICRALML